MLTLEKKSYYSYDDLVSAMDTEILIECHEGSYQGDSHYLMEKNGEYGILTFGWGSCSGCDALEAIGEDYDKVVSFMNDLYDEIEWMTLDEMKASITSTDFEGKFYFWTSEGNAFVKQLREWAS